MVGKLLNEVLDKSVDKESRYKNLPRNDEIQKFLKGNLFHNSRIIRNKIIHNDFKVGIVTDDGRFMEVDDINEDGLSYKIKNDLIIDIKHFNLLIRLVFFVATKSLKSELYTKYEKSTAISAYKRIFPNSNIEIT